MCQRTQYVSAVQAVETLGQQITYCNCLCNVIRNLEIISTAKMAENFTFTQDSNDSEKTT